MRIIGVLDLTSGRAVHARGGRRHEYGPVAAVCGHVVDGDPLALARAYTRVGVGELYAADLDAIAGRAWQDEPLRAIASLAPLWLDAGISSIEAAARAVAMGAAHVVVGLETLSSFDALAGVCSTIGGNRVAFSLDLRDGAPVGDAAGSDGIDVLARRAAGAGAGALIVLDVARVGSGRGPAFEAIAAARQAAPGVTLVVGGGVRDSDDLARLAAAGCDAALIATALHDGRITAVHGAAVRPAGPVSRNRPPPR